LGPQLQGHRSARQIAQAGVGRIIFFHRHLRLNYIKRRPL